MADFTENPTLEELDQAESIATPAWERRGRAINSAEERAAAQRPELSYHDDSRSPLFEEVKAKVHRRLTSTGST